MNDWGTLCAAAVTVAIYSFLYRHNPLYRVAEQLLIGLSVGYSLVLLWNSVLLPKLLRPLAGGNLWCLIPLALSLLILLRLRSAWGRYSKPVIALIIGAGAGLSIPAIFEARVLKQAAAAVEPFATGAVGVSSFVFWANTLLGLVGVLTVLIYFLYSRPQTPIMNGLTQIGVYFLMLFFGATFGYTVTSRLTLLIGRLEFLLGDVFHLL